MQIRLSFIAFKAYKREIIDVNMGSSKGAGREFLYKVYSPKVFMNTLTKYDTKKLVLQAGSSISSSSRVLTVLTANVFQCCELFCSEDPELPLGLWEC